MTWNEPSSLSGSDRLLCIYGTHGCGKSVLASSIVKGLKSKQQTLFFSFSGTDGKRQTVDSLVRTILWQLLEETTDQQCSEIMNDLMLRGPSATPGLLNAFEQTAKLMTGSVYCVIDGVDECIDECDDPTWGLVKHVLDLLNSLANLHVVLLGRPYALQAAIRATSLKIEMNSDLIKHDIKTFIYAKIESSPNLRIPELQDFVFKALQEKSDGMFLWVKLMIDDLRKSATQFEVMERLRNLPRGLERAYRLLFLRLVEKLGDLELIRARKVLALMIASCRALRVDELRYAYALDSRSGSTFEEHLFLQPDQGILDVCGDFINIRGGLVQLIHTSVKEFLTRPEEKWLRSDDREIVCFRVDLENAHRSLGCICIDYLGMNEYGFPLHDSDAFSVLGTQYPFLEYASRHAIPHLMRSGPPCSMITDKINDFLESGKFAHWVEYLAMFLVDDPSNSVLADELDIFVSWLNKGNHLCEPFEDKIRMSWRQELAKRTRKFGEDDLRTERWRNLLDLTRYAEPNPDSEVASTVFLKDPKESSDAVSQILNLLNSHTILPLPRQVDMILKLQSHLRRVKILNEPLRMLFGVILQVADKIPVHVLLVIGAFYDRLDKLEDALKVYYAALTKVENQEVHIKFVILENIGSALSEQKKYEAAEEIYRRAVEGREKVLGKEHTQTLDSVIDLGNAFYNQGKYKAAEEIYQRAAEGREKILGKEHTLTLDSVIDLGDALYSQGKYEAAEEIYRRAAEGREKVLGKEHAGTLISINNLGNALYYQGKYEAAEEVYRQAIEGREKVLGKEHAQTLNSVNRLGNALYNQGKHEAAEKIYQRAIEGREKVLGKEHAQTLNSVNRLGNALYNQGKYEAAEKMYQRAVEGREKVLGKEHAQTLNSVNYLGYALYSQGKYGVAEEMYRRAVEGREKVLGKEHAQTLRQ
jgi:tetratricopeptide (TPR) repeat protein